MSFTKSMLKNLASLPAVGFNPGKEDLDRAIALHDLCNELGYTAEKINAGKSGQKLTD